MKRYSAVLMVLAVGLATAQGWQFGFHPFHGNYAIYGGGLGDPYAPKRGDKHIAFDVEGQVAKEMFESIGPDARDSCGAEDGNRIRRRAQLTCSFHPKDGYHCAFGFDLLSGKSIGGSIC